MCDRGSTDDSIHAESDIPSGTGDGGRATFSRMATTIGLCYTAESIARALNHSTDAIDLLVDECRLLALTTADNSVVFPAFQLHNGRMVRGLPPVLRVLRKGIDDPWTWALWLNSLPPVVPGIAPGVSRIQQLINGEFDAVLQAAERSARSWRS